MDMGMRWSEMSNIHEIVPDVENENGYNLQMNDEICNLSKKHDQTKNIQFQFLSQKGLYLQEFGPISRR